MSDDHFDHDIHGLMLMMAPDGTVTADEDCDCAPDCAECDDEGVDR